MSKATIGVFSLLLLIAAVMIGVLAIGLFSPLYAAAYLCIAILSSGAVIAIFCTKCPLRGRNCVHLLPGMVAVLLPGRQGGYTAAENAAVSVAIVVIAAIPQYWLLSKLLLFVAFWLLGSVGLSLINRHVCPGCGNTCCPVRPKA